MSGNSIIERTELDNLVYIFTDERSFSDMEYKVLKSRSGSEFIRCSKIRYNGYNKLIYKIKDYRSMNELLPQFNIEVFVKIMCSILKSVSDVKNNGFMKTTNLLLDFNRVFLDTSSDEVKLLYIPVNTTETKMMTEEYTINFKKQLMRVISNNKHLYGGRIIELVQNLNDPSCNLDVMYGFFVNYHKEIEETKNSRERQMKQQYEMPRQLNAEDMVRQMTPETPASENTKQSKNIFKKLFKSDKEENHRTMYCLRGYNTPVDIKIDITKDEFIIGKSPDFADGVVSFNNAISRSHCKITNNGGNLFVSDLKSANGTSVNGKRIQPGMNVQVYAGDIIKMANSEFMLLAL